MLAEERRRPVRVRAAEERVARPAREVERDGIGNGRVREHGAQYPKHFSLHLRIGERFDAQRIVTLRERRKRQNPPRKDKYRGR